MKEVTAYDAMAQSLARAINVVLYDSEVMLDNDDAATVLSLFLKECGSALVQESTLHQGMAKQPGALPALYGDIKRNVAAMSAEFVTITPEGKRGGAYDAYKGTLFVLKDPR